MEQSGTNIDAQRFSLLSTFVHVLFSKSDNAADSEMRPIFQTGRQSGPGYSSALGLRPQTTLLVAATHGGWHVYTSEEAV